MAVGNVDKGPVGWTVLPIPRGTKTNPRYGGIDKGFNRHYKRDTVHGRPIESVTIEDGKPVGRRNGLPVGIYLPKDPGRRERLLASLRGEAVEYPEEDRKDPDMQKV